MANTRTTLVAVFSDKASATKANEELLNEGFSGNEVQLTSSEAAALSGAEAAYGNTGLTGIPANTHSSGGGIGSWLRSIFGSDSDESNYYAKALEDGGEAVTVTTDDTRADLAIEILNRYGAINIDEQDSYRKADVTSSVHSRLPDTDFRDEESMTAIPVIQEELAIGKRTVRRGGVRVLTSISEIPVEEQITLRDETVRVERRAVDRPATEADLNRGNEVIELTEVNEEAVVGKQARVVEEVVIEKETTQRAETIRDTVRRTEVEVENIGTQTDTPTKRV